MILAGARVSFRMAAMAMVAKAMVWWPFLCCLECWELAMTMLAISRVTSLMAGGYGSGGECHGGHRHVVLSDDGFGDAGHA